MTAAIASIPPPLHLSAPTLPATSPRHPPATHSSSRSRMLVALPRWSSLSDRTSPRSRFSSDRAAHLHTVVSDVDETGPSDSVSASVNPLAKSPAARTHAPRERNSKEDHKSSTASDTASGMSSSHAKKEAPRDRSKRKEKEKAPSDDKVRRRDGSGDEVPNADSGRTRLQEVLRKFALYLVPVLLAVPTSLLLHLITFILTPIYNSLPVTLHVAASYAVLTIVPATAYWLFTLSNPAQRVVSARVCLIIAAIAGDVVVIAGRRVGSLAGRWLAAQWGAWTARTLLSLGVVGGLTAFALLCFDHVWPLQAQPAAGRGLNLLNVTIKSAIYVLHIYYLERVWAVLLPTWSTSFLVQRPEKTILFISLLFTGLAIFFRAGKTSTSLGRRTHHFLVKRFRLSSATSAQVKDITSFLPRSLFPLLLLLRLPLLVLALRQQLFLRPSPPYFAAGQQLRVLHSERSLTGQLVVGEHLVSGFRFLRCDGSLLGGRWLRPNGTGVTMGDSIFATFPQQEIGVLAYRSDASESLARTISMTTELQVTAETEDEVYADKPSERALIVGLGVGISAQALSRRGLAMDVVEIDPLVHQLAVDHFGLSLPEDQTTVNIMSGATYVSQTAEMNREMNGTLQKWSYVIHDCFSAGKLPLDLYTREFWDDLIEMVEVDGIVSVNVAGMADGLAYWKIISTLLSVFTQCRAFGDDFGKKSGGFTNMVILCTMAHSPLLTFRPPTRFDVQNSPLRSHVYSSFHRTEISLDNVLSDGESAVDPDMIVWANSTDLDEGQIETSLDFWNAMQIVLTPEMWTIW